MANKIVPPRGMNDILPLDAQQREAMIQTILPVYAKWGFVSIECPAMENIDRLIGSDGGDNEKLVFQVLRRGLQEADYAANAAQPLSLVDMGLRYDLTVPMARFYASHHSHLPSVSKFLQYGSVWRAERPQKGRFRQFMQWDADIVGATEGLPEIELLSCSSEALLALGLENFTIRFNDRRVLKALVESVGIEEKRHDEAFIVIDKLDKVGLEGIAKEMHERSFADEAVNGLVEKIAPFLESKAGSIEAGLEQLKIDIAEDTRHALQQVFSTVQQQSQRYSIVFDPTLVRGMGYYTGQIFEIEYAGYSFSIAGGGRYDGMIGRFLQKDVPACGFSLGFDRILTILKDKNLWPASIERRKLLFLVPKSEEIVALKQANELRSQGWDVSMVIKIKNTKRQIQEFKDIGFTHFTVFNTQALDITAIA